MTGTVPTVMFIKKRRRSLIRLKSSHSHDSGNLACYDP
jgi:hypothetical protein